MRFFQSARFSRKMRKSIDAVNACLTDNGQSNHLWRTLFCACFEVWVGDLATRFDGELIRHLWPQKPPCRYGFGDSSVSALNYLYKGSRQNSVLPFLESDSFTIGNFIFRLEPGEYELDIEFGDGANASGYVADVRPRSVESFLVILGLRFACEATKLVIGPLPELENLDEFSPCSCPPLWISRRTGQTYTCLCFAYVAKKMWRRDADRAWASKAGDTDIPMRPGLCSICSDHVPPPNVTNQGYCNTFMKRYAPYRQLFLLKMFDGIQLEGESLKDAERIAEDAARLAVGYPLVGQKWISETTLYRTIRSILAPRIVIQHFQGKELEGQEIDVWVPSLKLAIEYHGPQHTQSLQAWGGEAALAAAKERDERKRRKLSELGYHLVEFQHHEQFTEETVLERRGVPGAMEVEAADLF